MEDNLLYEVAQYRKKRVIIDTDAACEADDPFAISHALMSKMLDVKGICAEHFVKPGSMEESYNEIKTILKVMETDVLVLKGAQGKMESCTDADNAAVDFIINEANRDDDMPLYILCMGALTNVALALQKCPDIAGKVTIITIGGNPFIKGKKHMWEFNFGNDVMAANTVLHSNAEVWMIPNNVYGTMHIGFAEIQNRIYPYGRLGKHLYENLIRFYSRPDASWSAGESWSFGDSPAVGVALEPNCGTSEYINAPRVLDDVNYDFSVEGPKIKVYTSINSRFIIEDFINKLQVQFNKKS